MAEAGESLGWPRVVVPSSSGHRAHAPPPLGRGVEALGPRRGLGEAPSAGRAPVTAQCLVCPVLVSLGLPLARNSLLSLPPDLHLPANPSSCAGTWMQDPIQGSPPPPLEPLFSRLP